MVRLSTQYDGTVVDNKKVGKVFMVRGDEAYARTTDTKFSIIDDATNSRDAIEGYRCGFKYDVLRDIGSSKLVLCDGDTELIQYDWSSDDGEQYVGVQSNHTTINPNTCLTLAYGVEHQLCMKYKGNKQCLGSKSRIITINEPIPDKFKTELALTTTKITNGVRLTITVTVNGEDISAVHDKPIEIYVGDTLVDTVRTGTDSNVATKEFTLSNEILHVTAIFVGDDEVYSGSASIDIHRGFVMDILAEPNPIIPRQNNHFEFKFSDLTGTPLSNVGVEFEATGDSSFISFTNSNGVVTFNLSYFSPRPPIIRVWGYGSVTLNTPMRIDYRQSVSASYYVFGTNDLNKTVYVADAENSGLEFTFQRRPYNWETNSVSEVIETTQSVVCDGLGKVNVDLTTDGTSRKAFRVVDRYGNALKGHIFVDYCLAGIEPSRDYNMTYHNSTITLLPKPNATLSSTGSHSGIYFPPLENWVIEINCEKRNASSIKIHTSDESIDTTSMYISLNGNSTGFNYRICKIDNLMYVYDGNGNMLLRSPYNRTGRPFIEFVGENELVYFNLLKYLKV